ncbi:MAG: hypothetical protein LKE85_15235 [Lachnospiraceae bacterium]|nr:hypothetical protein [Lachnospiraceae bacterium]
MASAGDFLFGAACGKQYLFIFLFAAERRRIAAFLSALRPVGDIPIRTVSIPSGIVSGVRGSAALFLGIFLHFSLVIAVFFPLHRSFLPLSAAAVPVCLIILREWQPHGEISWYHKLELLLQKK